MIVQKTIIQGISELLYNNDYVVVPGFGGFVAKHQLAHYSLNKGVLHPPSKKILFNVQLKQNDGILAGWLKEKLNCDFTEVTKHLEEFSNYSKMLLDTKRRLEFENLGLFYLDFENNICFEPKVDINFLIESFGLSSVSLKEIDLELEADKKQIIQTVDRFEKLQIEKPVKKRNYKRMAALIIGIPFITVALLFAVSEIQPNAGFTANVFGLKGKTANYSAVNYNNNLNELSLKPTEPYVVDANGYSSVNLFSAEKLTVVNISAPDKTEVKTKRHDINFNTTNLSGKFQVVLGCFGVEGNAKRMVKKLAKQNIKAGLSGLNAKGLHVVSGGGFDDKDSAQAFLISIKSQCPSAWVMTQ